MCSVSTLTHSWNENQDVCHHHTQSHTASVCSLPSRIKKVVATREWRCHWEWMKSSIISPFLFISSEAYCDVVICWFDLDQENDPDISSHCLKFCFLCVLQAQPFMMKPFCPCQTVYFSSPYPYHFSLPHFFYFHLRLYASYKLWGLSSGFVCICECECLCLFLAGCLHCFTLTLPLSWSHR